MITGGRRYGRVQALLSAVSLFAHNRFDSGLLRPFLPPPPRRQRPNVRARNRRGYYFTDGGNGARIKRRARKVESIRAKLIRKDPRYADIPEEILLPHLHWLAGLPQNPQPSAAHTAARMAAFEFAYLHNPL